MAKDPAFLFYTGDFHTGTQFFTDEQVGKFLRLLMAQHQHGPLSEQQVLHICKTYDKDIMKKFEKNDDGLYYNVRLKNEVEKRKSYSDSRKNNRLSKKTNKKSRKISSTYVNHMENENRNKDEIENKEEDKKSISEREKKFMAEVGEHLSTYPKEMLRAFFDYWSEKNKTETKMKFELEKTWDLTKRLARWAANNKNFTNGKFTGKSKQEQVADANAEQLRRIAEGGFGS